MSGLFLVLVKCPQAEAEAESTMVSSAHGRFLLQFESRYVADELFRALQDMRFESDPQVLGRITLRVPWKLVRISPQFWCYEFNRQGYAVNGVSQFERDHRSFETFNAKFTSTRLTHRGSEAVVVKYPIIPDPVFGTDWLNGNTFFIRNLRQPELYWFVLDDVIRVGKDHRSKFCVRGTAFNADDKKVLIRSDKITIEAVPETIIRTSYIPRNAITPQRYPISLVQEETPKLRIGDRPVQWLFGDLFLHIGVSWDWRTQSQYATYMPNGGGDEWELC
ncbi:hypothetical protein BDZ97DRAFT_1914236 [Flammula alnicola]|nr:hypothetical protein BDZ97DRAFT_1914236 [Flammula alnicola]